MTDTFYDIVIATLGDGLMEMTYSELATYLAELRDKAEALGDISAYPENKFGPLTVLEYLDLVEMQAEHYTERALISEKKLRAIKHHLENHDHLCVFDFNMLLDEADSEFTTKDEE